MREWIFGKRWEGIMSISSMNESGREGDGLVYKEPWSNITTQKQTGNGTDSSLLGGN